MDGSFIQLKTISFSFTLCSALVPSPVLSLKVRTQKSTRKIRSADSPAACDGQTDYLLVASTTIKTQWAKNMLESSNSKQDTKALGKEIKTGWQP